MVGEGAFALCASADEITYASLPWLYQSSFPDPTIVGEAFCLHSRGEAHLLSCSGGEHHNPAMEISCEK